MGGLENLLVAFHSESFKEDKDWDQLSETPWSDVDPIVLDEHLAHGFRVDGIWNDSRNDGVELWVPFHQNSVLYHLLLNEQHFLGPVDYEVTPGVVGAFLEVGEFLLGLTNKMALRAAQHDGHPAYFYVFPLLYRPVQVVFDIDTNLGWKSTKYRPNTTNWRSLSTADKACSIW